MLKNQKVFWPGHLQTPDA
jgi:hypothetical protein